MVLSLRRCLAAGALAALAITAFGCIRKEISSTWYIEPDLSVVWSVLERDVRSSEDNADDRRRAEAEFIGEARQHNQPVARGLRQFNPTSLRSTVLRDKAPFTVGTDAAFPSLKILGERILGRLGLTGYSAVELTPGGYQWTWSIDPHAKILDDAADEDLLALFETEVIQMALSRGEFSETNGIHLSDDRRIATFPIGEILNSLEKKESDEPTVFTVRWTDR